jgi:hypothetical protein
MNVIRHPADLHGFHFVFTRNAPDEFPNALLDFVRNPGLPLFGAEDDMVMKRHECVCHQVRLADGRRHSTAQVLPATEKIA